MSVYYEGTFILKGDLEESDVEKAAAAVKECIEKEGGKLIKLDDWGKKRLAYRVKKHRYGYYLHTQYELDPTKTKNLEWNFKMDENILKCMMLRISENELEPESDSAGKPEAAAASTESSTEKVTEKSEQEE